MLSALLPGDKIQFDYISSKTPGDQSHLINEWVRWQCWVIPSDSLLTGWDIPITTVVNFFVTLNNDIIGTLSSLCPNLWCCYVTVCVTVTYSADLYLGWAAQITMAKVLICSSASDVLISTSLHRYTVLYVTGLYFTLITPSVHFSKHSCRIQYDPSALKSTLMMLRMIFFHTATEVLNHVIRS